MANYKVIALSVGGKGNKIFNSGDTVTELNFPEGNAAKLVEEGFLELIPSEETPEPTVELPATEIEVVDEVPVAPEAETKAEETPEPTVETKPEPKKKK
jgi:hypothetical protein